MGGVFSVKRWFAVLLITAFVFVGQATHMWAAPAKSASISNIRANIDSNRRVTVSGTLSTGAGQVVSLRILDPNGNAEYAGSTVTGSWGDFQFSFTMKGNTAGDYHVTLNALGLAGPLTTSLQYGVNCDLHDLVISAGAFDKAFSPVTTEYAVSLDHRVSSITLTPTVSDLDAKVRVNDIEVVSGSPSNPILLQEGINTVHVVVTALSGKTKTYRVTVTRQAAISPTLTAHASIDANRRVKVNGTVSSGAGQTISLLITGPGGYVEYAGATVSTYGGNYSFSYTLSGATKGRFSVSVRALGVAQIVTTYFDYGNDARLQSLSLSNGSLSPWFSSDVTFYTVDVGSEVSHINVVPTPTDADARIKVNDMYVNGGTVSSLIALKSGVNTISIDLTAQDGVTARAYTVVVNREEKQLPAGISVTAQIDREKQVTVSGTTASPGQQVSVMITDPSGKIEYLNSTTSGTAGLFQVSYTMSNSTKGRYDVTVRGFGLTSPELTYFIYDPDNADLRQLTISNGILIPGFAPAVDQYITFVGHSISSIRVVPTAAAPDAIIRVNGMAVSSGESSGSLDLAVGENRITIVVTSQDGSRSKTYSLTVKREPYIPSDNANLGGLAISSGTLSPAFTAGTTNYTVSVGNAINSLTVTPTVADGYATARVNGVVVASGTASGAIGLVVGDNIISVVVTAESGFTRTYTITVTREAALSSDASLSSLGIAGEGDGEAAIFWAPAFAPHEAEYTITASMFLLNITLYPTVNEGHATVTINGTPVESGTPYRIDIDHEEDTTILVIVTAQDRITTRAYVIFIPAD